MTTGLLSALVDSPLEILPLGLVCSPAPGPSGAPVPLRREPLHSHGTVPPKFPTIPLQDSGYRNTRSKEDPDDHLPPHRPADYRPPGT
jgi:hypothetical protein